MSNAETIAGRTLDEWQEFARRDDCKRMVPSDLRQLIGRLSRAIDATRAHEHVLADLVAKYYRREIGVLMQQAEHWASEKLSAGRPSPGKLTRDRQKN